jgi:hypothetical protein
MPEVDPTRAHSEELRRADKLRRLEEEAAKAKTKKPAPPADSGKE